VAYQSSTGKADIGWDAGYTVFSEGRTLRTRGLLGQLQLDLESVEAGYPLFAGALPLLRRERLEDVMLPKAPPTTSGSNPRR